MKTKVVIFVLAGVALLFSLFYFFGSRSYTAQHPTLSVQADLPDIHLKHVKYYAEDHRYNRGIFHLDRAIAAIRNIERDVDSESGALLELAITKLDEIHKELVLDSLKTKDLYDAFDYTLSTLARAELEVSEMYAETNQRDLAKLAMKHAQLHLKNALLFEDSMWYGDSLHLEVEKKVYAELDSLIDNEAISPTDLTLRIDDIIKEMNQLLENR